MKSKFLFSIFLCLIFSMMSSCKDQSLKLNFDVQEKELENGLKVIVVENPKLPIFSYYTYYKVGGKFEVPGITGASHFLEHMMFKGAKKYGLGEFDKIVEGNGGRNNAYTTNDLTVYYEDLPNQHLEVIIDLEADRMQNLLLEKNAFEKERNVVLEERKMRYENSDRGKLYLQMMKEVFKGTPYGTSVIGTIKDLKTVTRDQIYEYFKMFYAPNNAVIVIVGDVKANKVFKEIEEKFGKIPASKELAKAKEKNIKRLGFDFKAKFDREVKIKGVSPTPMFMLSFKGIEIGHKDSYALDILSSVIGDGESSLLHRQFVTSQSPQLEAIYAANYTLQNSGVFFIGGYVLKDNSLEKVKTDILNSIRNACKKGFTDRQVQRVKNQYLVDTYSQLDTNAGIARFLGDREVFYGSYKFFKDEISLYNNVDSKDLERVCKKYLNKSDSILVSIHNKY